MTMIERVARAIQDKIEPDDGSHSTYLEIARAAIAAMREPTEAIIVAATVGTLAPIDAAWVWQALIDAALSE